MLVVHHRFQAIPASAYRSPHRTYDHRAWEYLLAGIFCAGLGVVLALVAWLYLVGVRGL